MQSDRKYQLPVSNIAYHVYSPEEDIIRSKSISQEAFRRTMDNYQEYEHLADLFQVELAKRDQETQERKGRSLKTPKKSSKKPQQSRNQEPAQPSQPERQSLRRLRNSSANASNNSIAEENNSKDITIDKVSTGEKSGSLKRSRQNSDVSTSDISGNGDDEAKFHQTPSKSTSIRQRSVDMQTNERSLSNSPVLPLTPSPRLTPSDSTNMNKMITESSMNHSIESLAQSKIESSDSPRTNLGHVSTTFPSHTTSRRNKRKQAIPVHPSVVDRIPGITLRIQRENMGDQLQVEILKNLDDYSTRQDNQSPTLKLQALQDLRKVKESIESGRPGYAFFPASLLNRIEDSPDLTGSLSSVDSFALLEDSYDVRSLPLSWENFSTRECVMNKVIGKHDKDLDILEEVVQDVILRNHYNDHQQQQRSQSEKDSESNNPEVSNSQRRRSRISTSPSTAALASTPVLGSVSTMSLKSAGTSTSPITRSAPGRSTRSRKHISDQYGDNFGGDDELIAHEDIEFVLKQKRRRKLEERRKRQGSKGSSKGNEDDEDDDDDDDEDNEDGKDDEDIEMSHRKGTFGESKEMDDMQDMYSNKERDIYSTHSYSDRNQDSKNGDIPMTTSNKLQNKGQMQDYSNDVKGVLKRQPEDTVILAARTRGGPVQSRRQSDVYVYEGLTESSDSVSESEDDDDYKDRSYKSSYTSRKRSLPLDQATVANHPESNDTAESTRTPEQRIRAERKMANKKLTQIDSTATERGSESLEESRTLPAEPPRRHKKSWTRGRNTRKEDLVATTDDEDESSSFEDADGDKVMTLAKHIDREEARLANNDSHSSTHGKRGLVSTSSHMPTPTTYDQKVVEDDGDHLNNSSRRSTTAHESGGRTRARARSFSSTIDTDDKTKFYENALGVMKQKRREALAKKRATREAEEKERNEREQQEQREREFRDERERRELAVMQQQQEIAQKAESSNQPKSSKSLPGRVLRRTRMDPSSMEDVDPDCTSCRLELSADDKSLWKIALESKEIVLPKTWGAHAILCTACRLLYLDHHWRCTACFYVPVKDELPTSSCSRCKAGTWLKEAVKMPTSAGVDKRRRTKSDDSV
ncbi:hypothetical protein BGZ76_004625 [Entomortierella beljakovae]|nr:hypothetical protein BGZ76_004625 [Entomortierella beljakovae]